MTSSDVQGLLTEGYDPKDIWVDGETASGLVGISKKTLDRWRSNGDFIQPKALGTRGLAKLGKTDKGNVRKSQVLRYQLSAVREFLEQEPIAGTDGENEE